MKRVHRTLHIGHAESHGQDVRAFTNAVSKCLKHLKLGFLFQMRTPASRRHTIARCAFALGLNHKECKDAREGHVSKAVQRKIRSPHLRSLADHIRAQRRREHLKKWRVNHRNDSHVMVMYDSVEAHLVPPDAPAVAGYVDGAFTNYHELSDLFPHAKHCSIAVRASSDADVLDVEPGDATPDQVVAWVRRQMHKRRTKSAPLLYNLPMPCIYGSVSTMVEVIHHLRVAGMLEEVLLFSAHTNEGEHICGPNTCAYPGLTIPCGATQWLWTHDFDKSKLKHNFF